MTLQEFIQALRPRTTQSNFSSIAVMSVEVSDSLIERFSALFSSQEVLNEFCLLLECADETSSRNDFFQFNAVDIDLFISQVQTLVALIGPQFWADVHTFASFFISVMTQHRNSVYSHSTDVNAGMLHFSTATEAMLCELFQREQARSVFVGGVNRVAREYFNSPPSSQPLLLHLLCRVLREVKQEGRYDDTKILLLVYPLTAISVISLRQLNLRQYDNNVFESMKTLVSLLMGMKCSDVNLGILGAGMRQAVSSTDSFAAIIRELYHLIMNLIASDEIGINYLLYDVSLKKDTSIKIQNLEIFNEMPIKSFNPNFFNQMLANNNSEINKIALPLYSQIELPIKIDSFIQYEQLIKLAASENNYLAERLPLFNINLLNIYVSTNDERGLAELMRYLRRYFQSGEEGVRLSRRAEALLEELVAGMAAARRGAASQASSESTGTSTSSSTSTTATAASEDASRMADDEDSEAINAAQKTMIKIYLDLLFEDLHDNGSKKAFFALTTMNPSVEITAEVESKLKAANLWDIVKQVRDIYAHPCPQNSAYSIEDDNGPTVAYYLHGTYHTEDRGILGLTAKNNNTAPPITKAAVVKYVASVVEQEFKNVHAATRIQFWYRDIKPKAQPAAAVSNQSLLQAPR